MNEDNKKKNNKKKNATIEENLLVHLKKKVGKRTPTSKNEWLRFIKEEWEKIPSEYDILKLLQFIRRRLQAAIDPQGGHTKY